MPSDDQLTPALDRLLTSIRERLAEDFRTLTQQVSQTAAADRARAVGAATEAATAELRRQAQQQVVQAREAAQKEVREALQKDVEEARRSARQQVEEVQRLTELRLATTREQARNAARARAARIIEGVSSLDQGRALADVLERLAHAAAAHADRAVMFIVRNGALREWRRVGSAPASATADVRPEDAGFLADVVKSASAVMNDRGPLPACVGGGRDRDAVGVPVTVGGQVVAVLYCDAPAGDEGADTWRAMVEVLARYASRVLETMTVQQATGLRPGAGMAQA